MLFRPLLCVLIGLSLTAGASAQIYKTVDKDGKVIYTDKPRGDQPAEPLNLPPINTLPPENANNYPQIGEDVQPESVNYQVSIISPRENVTIPPGERDLGIAVTLNRPLAGDHWLLYFMNGELLEETQASNIVIQDVFRGSHTIVVEVIDSNGNSLGKSSPVVVNVIRPIVKPQPAPAPKPNS